MQTSRAPLLRWVALVARRSIDPADHDATYAFAHWGNVVIHLALDENPEEHMSSVLYFHVDDADEVTSGWREAGMEGIGPEDQDHGNAKADTSTPR